MLSKSKMTLAAALLLGSVSASFAQAVVPEYDGDANRIRGYYDVLPGSHSMHRSFAAQHSRVTPSSEANGPAWENYFDNWLSQND